MAGAPAMEGWVEQVVGSAAEAPGWEELAPGWVAGAGGWAELEAGWVAEVEKAKGGAEKAGQGLADGARSQSPGPSHTCNSRLPGSTGAGWAGTGPGRMGCWGNAPR